MERKGNLCLSRKTGQSINAGEVTITVVRVKGDRVWLAVQAPVSVSIRRSELEEKERAA